MNEIVLPPVGLQLVLRDEPASHGRLRSVLARSILLVIVGLSVGTTGYLFAKQAAVASPPAIGGYSSTGALGPTLCPHTQGPRPRLTLEVSALDLRNNTVRLTAYLCLDQEAERRLYIAARKDGVFRFLTPQRIPEEAVTGLAARMAMIFMYHVPQEGQTEYDKRLTFNLAAAEGLYPGWGLKIGAMELPLHGSQASYPLDRYRGGGEVEVGGQDTTEAAEIFYCAHSPDTCPREDEFGKWPVSESFVRGPGIAPYDIRAVGNGFRFQLFLERPISTQIFVIFVACIPLILGCLLALVLFSSQFSSTRSIGSDGVMGVAAVLLAILPIRLVLVPTEVSELTLVDYLLGFEMTVLASLAALAVRRGLRAQARKAPE